MDHGQLRMTKRATEFVYPSCKMTGQLRLHDDRSSRYPCKDNGSSGVETMWTVHGDDKYFWKALSA
jgi:hypothetical protein